LVRIAVGSDPGSTDMGRLQREWISQPHSLMFVFKYLRHD
jgi:hypothetical protein